MSKIILITGKKQSGKDTSCEAIKAHLGIKFGDQIGIPIKSYSFATPLKRYLIDVMGLTEDQCNGTNEQKNSETHIRWVDLPFSNEQLTRYFVEARFPDQSPSFDLPYVNNCILYLQGENIKMTAREVMQYFGSNICRRMYNDCFAEACKKTILRDNPGYAFITDARFPNELEVFRDLDPIVIRLKRNKFNSKHTSEIGLDGYDFSYFKNFILIDNEEMSLEDKNNLVIEKIKDLL